MAIHAIFKRINDEFPNEQAYVFIDYLNGLYVIKTQIKHPILNINHPNKIILNEIVVLTTKNSIHHTI